VSQTLRGVIAAIATPIDESGAPDLKRATNLARYLLDSGCDGLNVLGTTGEATSFSRDERMAVMSACKAEGLPLERLMVGTGAAAVSDAVALTQHAAELGFAGALILPPFYYKGVPDDGLVAYIDIVVKETSRRPIPIYLYHFPAQSGLWGLFRPVSWDSKIRPATWPTPMRSLRSPETSPCFPRPKRCYWMRAAARLPAASRPRPISMPIFVRGLGAQAMWARSMLRSQSANCSTVSRWCLA